MKTKFLIFDFDGTLVESMFIWKNLGEFYLRSKNINIVDNNISKIFSTMSYTESIIYLQKKYLLNHTIKEIYTELDFYIKKFYFENVFLKKGVKEFLHNNKDKHMCIASESKKEIIIKLLDKFNIKNFFEFIITSDDVKSTKKENLIYNKCLNKFGANINNTILFEDAIYAIETANKINLKTICILDQYSNSLNLNSVKCLKIINNFNELGKYKL